MNLSSPPTSGLNLSSPPTGSGPSLSTAPRASGLMNEPPLSPGPAPVPVAAAVPAPPAATPPPSLEAQVVRLGLMTTAEVATTMQEQAETGRPFAELAVEHGRIRAEDLARLTSSEAAPAVAPVTTPERQLTPVPPPAEPELISPPALLHQPEHAPEPPTQASADPEPVVKITLEPQAAPEPQAALESQAPEPQVALEPPARPVPPAAPKPGAVSKASVFVRLTSGERISGGQFESQEAAEQRARELMIAIDAGGDWPRVDGRFIKPDAVVSIDVDAS
jgi:hypothetical protein